MSSTPDNKPHEPSSSPGNENTYADTPVFPEAPENPFGMKRVGVIVTIIAVVVIAFLFIAFPWMTDGAKSSGNPSNVVAGTVKTITYHKNIDEEGEVILNCAPIAVFSIGNAEYIAGPKTKVSPCPWYEGQIVNVLYDESNPENAYIGAIK